MMGIERDILFLVSRARCITENQVSKMFGGKKRNTKRQFKKTLRKMCSDYILRKQPCDIDYYGFKDNSYIYYLNGSEPFKGEDLAKTLIGSEIMIKSELSNLKIKRFYRNVKVDKDVYDIFIEYLDEYSVRRQVLIDINLSTRINIQKYYGLSEKINNCTIPFFQIPKVLVVTQPGSSPSIDLRFLDIEIEFIDISLNKLLKHL